MSERWALCLPADAIPLAARWRLTPGVECCAAGESLWLRGPWDDASVASVRGFPAGERYRVSAAGELYRFDAPVPTGRLPEGDWRPIGQALQVGFPLAAVPAPMSHYTQPHVEVALVRDDQEREASLLLVDLRAWLAYAQTAPQVRLERWTFAVDGQGHVLVRGTPLPPLPGVSVVDAGGVLVPAGWRWTPAIEPAVLRAACRLAQNEFALWQPDRSWQKLHAADFVRATRSAIRQSAAELRAELGGGNV